MPLDPQQCYRAVLARDVRSDGRFFTCVTSTGIYCRPICAAKVPRYENTRFLPSAAAAQAAGFRPCLRCRPELSPTAAAWRGTESSVARALSLIAEGALDGETEVSGLAERLGLGERQLRRLFARHLGASPVAVAQTRRLLFAKQLIHETSLSLAEVALAAGFGSVRRFNAVFHGLYGRPPSQLRRALRSEGQAAGEVTLRLGYRPPYAWPTMLAYLGARALPGVERVEAGCYARTLRIDGVIGWLEVAQEGTALRVKLRLPTVRALPIFVGRLRRALDLDADLEIIAAHLATDPRLAPLVRARPGLRLPAGFDGFETGVRAILCQQVSLAAARRLGTQLVALAGSTLEPSRSAGPGLDRLFPTPAQLLAADLDKLGLPGARRRALITWASAVLADPALSLSGGSTLEQASARLGALTGFGDWTAQVVALRAGHADAFPAGDVALQRAAARLDPALGKPAALLAHAESWRPWRGYAAQLLWNADVQLRAELSTAVTSPEPTP